MKDSHQCNKERERERNTTNRGRVSDERPEQRARRAIDGKEAVETHVREHCSFLFAREIKRACARARRQAAAARRSQGAR